MGAIGAGIQVDHSHPGIDQPGVLPGAYVLSIPAAAGEQPVVTPSSSALQSVAKAAGLKVGDSLTLQLLGREMDVRIAALRRTEPGGFGTNFLLVLNAAAIEGANPRSVAIARASPAEERALTQALGADFREVNIISVREQLEAAATLFDRLALAIRGAAAVAGLAGLLVLIGAIAAGVRVRPPSSRCWAVPTPRS